MVDLGTGVKSGAITGGWNAAFTIAYFIISTKLFVFEQAIRIAIIFSTLIKAVIWGILLGIIFALLYNWIPLKKSIQKAIAFYIVFFVALALSSYYLGLVDPGDFPIYLLLVIYLIDGVILGYFWDRFSKSVKSTVA